MIAHVYYLGGSIAVCELTDDEGQVFVGEATVAEDDSVTILPQSLRLVVDMRSVEVEVADEPTAQDHVDRAAHGLERFRQRLATFDPDWADAAAMSRWAEQAIGARDDLVSLIGKLRAEKGVAW